MEWSIIGGDERFGRLARLLEDRGARVRTLGRERFADTAGAERDFPALAENIVVNCPPRGRGAVPSIDDILEEASDAARVFCCGPGHPASTDARLIDLWADEALLLENARLTAEGAVAAAMRTSSRSIKEMRCLVIGWGRIGRELTELLVAIGASVTVASRSAHSRCQAVARGARTAFTEAIADALPGQQLIFNTAPAMVLDEDALRRAERDVMIVDLASPPYGVDLWAAWRRGMRAWREPGLPGRYCPTSAAQALLDAMDRYALTAGGNHYD